MSDRIFPPVLLCSPWPGCCPGCLRTPKRRRNGSPCPCRSGVVDATHTLDEATRQRLVEKLEALERRRGAQIAVVMLPTTGTLDIEAFSDKLFQAWKLGRKAVDDGLLLVVAKDDRRMRIEVGYGLEGCGARCGRRTDHSRADGPGISREGDYAGGIEAAVDELIPPGRRRNAVGGRVVGCAGKSRWGNCRRKPGRCWSPSSTDRWPECC
ncbi:TPM domain-containing protein [Pseudomonas aeruginosa]